MSSGAHIRVQESNRAQILSPTYTNSHSFGIGTEIGLLFNDLDINPFWVLGIDFGIGFIRFKNPDINLIPVSFGLKLFFNNLDNSVFLSGDIFGSLYKEDKFNKSGGIEIGAGYKFFLFDFQCFIAQISYRQHLISMTERNYSRSPHKVNIDGIVFSIGIMPF